MVNAENHAHRALEELRAGSQLRLAQVQEKINASPNVSDKIRPRVLSNTLHCVSSPASGTPLAATEQQVAQFENTERRVTAWVDNHYHKIAPTLMVAHLSFGLNSYDGGNPFRKITRLASDSYRNFFANTEDSDGNLIPHLGTTHDIRSEVDGELIWPWEWEYEPVPVVISTSRPGHRWLIRGEQTFESVAEVVQNDAWCDLNISGRGYCVESLRRRQDIIDAGFLPNIPLLLPFAQGDLLILSHTCSDCWQKLVKENGIKLKECKILDVWCDGF